MSSDYREYLRKVLSTRPDIKPAEMFSELQSAGFSDINKAAIKHVLAKARRLDGACNSDVGAATERGSESPCSAHGSSVVGALVEIRGLESRPELNGLTARILSFDPDAGRYAVELAEGGGADAEQREPAQLKLEAEACRILPAGDDTIPDGEGRDRVAFLIRKGYLYSAEVLLSARPDADLRRAWIAKVAEGVSHEIVCEPTFGTPSMKLVDVPGKGIGYVAQRSIKPGEVVLVDTVFAIVNHTDDYENLDMAEEIIRRSELSDSHRQCFEQKVDVLSCPSTKQPLFQMQAASRGLPDHFARLANISDSNAFSHRGDLAERPPSLQRRPMPRSFTLLPMGSRFNHSCRPNALMRMGSDRAATAPGPQSRAVSGVAYFTAVRSIQAGEEVTTGYVPARDSLAVRTEKLAARGFDCCCSRCDEERRLDPNTTISCKCGQKHWQFHEDGDTPVASCSMASSAAHGSCQACNFKYDRADVLRRYQMVEAIVAHMSSGAAANDDPRQLLMFLLKAPEASYGIFHPENYMVNMILVNHISSCQMMCATRDLGLSKSSKMQAMQDFIASRLHLIKWYERVCGIQDEPDSVPCMYEFAEMYYRFVGVIQKYSDLCGLSKAEIHQYRNKLEWTCQVLYGQPDLPDSEAKLIQIG